MTGRGGDVFVLDTGNTIRMPDLDQDRIRLAGLEPDRDIVASPA